MKFWSYKYLQKLFLLVFVLVTVVNIRFVQADTSPGGCQTNIMKNSEQCSWDEFKSWSANRTNSCVVEKTGCTNTASTTGNVFCNTPLAFSVCECKTGYFNCSTTGICIQRTPAANCGDYNSCTGYCTSCITGYTISNGGTASAQCLGATLKLGPDSVSGATAVVQSTNNTLMYLGGSGVSIGTSTIPGATALNVVGATMFSENLSMINNKSIKVDNADSNTTLLIGNYGDGQGFGYGASTTRTASLVVEGDVKGNRLCIKEDCRAEWTDIQGTSYWTASSTYIYNNNSGNVGIGDNEPYNKLSVGGNITGSGSLVITGTATSSNYFISNLGVGGLPSGFWNKFVDLSGSGNSAYIVKTGSINAVVAASDSGTPAGTGYNFTHSGQQMVLGTVTSQPLNFITNGTSKMFLSADGKLGIGTTSPAEMLDVNGGTRIGTINNATGDIVTVSSSGVITKRTAEEIRDDIAAAKEINSLYYVEGNTTGTAGTWTGNIDGLDAYYDGLTIAYKIGIAGASGLTLNINNLGAKAVRRNTAALTTHLPIGTVVVLTYTTISGTSYWVWADYDAGESYYYLRWNYANVTAGAQTTGYKIIMEGHDGRFYPLTIGNSTSANGKTVSSAKFKMNGQVLWHVSTTVINENAPFTATNLYSDYYSTVANYTFNQVSGWIANKSVYLVGTIDNDGYFVLDGAGSTGTGFLSQDLPTTDDGKIYILLGYMTNNTSGFKLTPDRVAYHYKDGKIRLYETMSGTGSSNYITKWTGSTALGNSQIYDNSTNVGIGITNPVAKLDVNGSLAVSGSVSLTGPLYTTEGNRLLMVDDDGSVTATTTLSGVSMPPGSLGQTLYYGSTGWQASSTIFVKNTGNVGIGDNEPYNKLSVTGNIFGSESLLITNNGTIMGNLGVGSLSTQTWARYLDLSGSGNSAYLSRTASVTAAFITSETGTPSGTGYNLGHSGQQMALGSLSSHPINFITGATSKMFLTADGKLGIGTTSPDSILNLYPANNSEGLRIVSSNYSPLVIMSSSSNNLFRVNQFGDVTAVTSSATRMRSNNYCDANGDNCFNPSSGWASGNVSYFATVTSSTYSGDNNNNPGYAYANGLCNSQMAGTRVCSAEGILNTIKLNKEMPQEDVWIFSGVPGYIASVNDCEARSSAAATGKYGTYWQGPNIIAGYPLGRGLITLCNNPLKLACCY